MGDSQLWWYPDGATAAEKIDLKRKLSDLELGTERFRADATPGWGSPIVVDQGGYRTVRIVLERIASGATVRALQSFCDSHAVAGKVFSFSLESAKAWCSWCSVLPQRGDTTLRTYGNRFATAYGAASLAANDEFTVESPNPEYKRERLLYSSASGGVLTMTAAAVQDYLRGPACVRWADFYPALRLAPGAGEPLTHDRRLNWTLDLECEEWPGDLAALEPRAGMLGSSGLPGHLAGLVTLDTAVVQGEVRAPAWTRTSFAPPVRR